MNNVIQKQFPLMVSMIDLLAANPTVIADPVLDCALASLKQQLIDTWEEIDAIYETSAIDD